MSKDWYRYKGDNVVRSNALDGLEDAPSWRGKKGNNYQPTDQEIESINAAILLRRPLLLTGNPGTGKSSLAYAVANDLGLELYHWAINSKSTLQEGLYQYDAISRLHDVQSNDKKNIKEYLSRTSRQSVCNGAKVCVAYR